jgi:hypothetical protein
MAADGPFVDRIGVSPSAGSPRRPPPFSASRIAARRQCGAKQALAQRPGPLLGRRAENFFPAWTNPSGLW